MRGHNAAIGESFSLQACVLALTRLLRWPWLCQTTSNTCTDLLTHYNWSELFYFLFLPSVLLSQPVKEQHEKMQLKENEVIFFKHHFANRFDLRCSHLIWFRCCDYQWEINSLYLITRQLITTVLWSLLLSNNLKGSVWLDGIESKQVCELFQIFTAN